MHNKIKTFLYYPGLCALILVTGCISNKPFIRPTNQVDPADRPDNPRMITFYALGDWGSGNERQKAVATALNDNVQQISDRNLSPFVVGLGDNVYEDGLPQGWGNPEVEYKLQITFGEIYGDVKYKGDNLIYHIVPGNHDHGGIAGGKNGMGDVIHQETTAEHLYENWRYYPIDPSKNSDTNDSTDYQNLIDEDIYRLTLPEKMDLGDSETVSLFALDTQVLLELHTDEEKYADLIDLHYSRLEKLVNEDKAEWKIIVGHHPLVTHGRHKGYFPKTEMLWSGSEGWIPIFVRPLTIVWLPFTSTNIEKIFTYPTIQDVDHSAYKKFKQKLLEFMKENEIKLYLAGHEHNLQFIELDSTNACFQVISGSAGKLNNVSYGDDSHFSHSAYGFVRLDFTDDKAWIEFFDVNVKTNSSRSTALFQISK